MSRTFSSGAVDNNSRSCNCIGPQNGQPFCPCRMSSLVRIPGVGLVQVMVPEKPLLEPPADAEVAQAERAVIEAANALLPTKLGTLTERWRVGNVERAARALIEARQRSAAAKEQG